MNYINRWDIEHEDRKDREGMIDCRMVAVAAFGSECGWPIAKRKGVASYVRKVLIPMTMGELALMMPTNLQELVEHAAHGYDRVIAPRRAGR